MKTIVGALLLGLPATLLAKSTQELEHEVDEMHKQIATLTAMLDEENHERRLAMTGAQMEAKILVLEGNVTTVATAAADASTAAAAGDAELGAALDSCWLLICGTLVMFMHAGFAMLESGCCRAKNVSNVLLKNLTNLCVGTLAWYICGWAFAYGGPDEDGDGMLDNGFIGTGEFFGMGFTSTDDSGNIAPYEEVGQSKMLGWFFQWAFCTAAATIVSGGVAERVQSPTYGCYAFVMAGFIYPVVVAWTWGYGWIAGFLDVGFMDFAGSGVVHLTGGASAIAGAIILGPRKGRFENPEEFEPHNMPLVVLGTLSLWFGWYGFNCGSTLGMSDAATGAMGAQVAMNTTLSAATGGITAFVVTYIMTKLYDVSAMCNGILAGLVSITAGCGNMDCGSAIFTGMLGSCIFVGSSKLQKKLKIDDPVDASSVHGACGIWGVLACGLFDWGKGLDQVHGWSGFSCMTNEDGTCQTGIWGSFFATQLVMCIVICLWSGGLSGLTFFALMKTGKLRINEEVEDAGMDKAHHSPSKAYSMTA